MSRLLKSAVVLGAVPLLVGTIIYSAWRATRWKWLEDAGLGTIFVGIAAVILGAAALSCHLWREARVQRPTGRRLWLQGVMVGGLLIANFPAAAFFAVSAFDLSTRWTVRVFNDSDHPIESLVVTGPGVRVELGPIAPGQRSQRDISFRGDGTLDFSARQQEVLAPQRGQHGDDKRRRQRQGRHGGPEVAPRPGVAPGHDSL